jgi:hypothetical protein
MCRLLLALIVILCVLPSAPASLSGRRDVAPFDKIPPGAFPKAFPATLAQQLPARAGRPEFQLTEETEVFLDGRPCQYKEVPRNVSIIRLEVASDNKTILKIHFRTRK